MSGGGGGVIIIKSTIATLSDPLVHGGLPQHVKDQIDPILAKDPADWTDTDKDQVGKAYHWALRHLQ